MFCKLLFADAGGAGCAPARLAYVAPLEGKLCLGVGSNSCPFIRKTFSLQKLPHGVAYYFKARQGSDTGVARLFAEALALPNWPGRQAEKSCEPGNLGHPTNPAWPLAASL